MSRTPTDALRSLKRYTSSHLPDEYAVYLTPEEGTFGRPTAMVETAGPVIPSGQPKLMEVIRPHVIYAWPEAQSGGAEPSKLEAERIADILTAAFRIGGNGGRPARIPLFDYDGVAYTDPLPDGAEAEGMMWLLDCSVDTRADPEDDTLWTVICEIRLRWMRLGERRPDTNLLQEVRIAQRSGS